MKQKLYPMRSVLQVVLIVFSCFLPAVLFSQDYSFQISRSPGTVRATMVKNNILFVGGRFEYIGLHTGGLVALNPNTAAVRTDFARLFKKVTAIENDGTGGFYVASGNVIWHILSTGAVDPNWGGLFGSIRVQGLGAQEVYALHLSGNTLYIGGSFTQININGVITNRSRLAALDVSNSGSLITTWAPSINNTVNAIATSGSTVYIGGSFTSITINGSTTNRRGLVAIENGSLSAWNPFASALSGTVFALKVHATRLYIGGMFNTTVASQSVQNLFGCNLPTSTSVTVDWRPSVSSTVYSIVPLNNTLYIGGSFSSVNGTTRNNIAALDLTSATGNLSSWNPNANNRVVNMAIDPTSNTLYAVGCFTAIGGASVSRIAALDLTVNTNNALPAFSLLTNASACGGFPDNGIQTVAFIKDPVSSASAVLVGGNFTSAGGVKRTNLAALDLTTTPATILPWDPAGNAGDTVHALAASSTGDTIYVGGRFNSIAGQPRTNLAAIEFLAASDRGEATAWNPNTNDVVLALATSVTYDTIFVGGRFSSLGEQSRNHIGAVNRNGITTTWDPKTNNTVRALCLDAENSRIYIGGRFTIVDGNTRNGAAAVHTTTGNVTAWNPSFTASKGNPAGTSEIYAIQKHGDNVYVGGDFLTVNGIYATYQYLAKVNAADGTVDPNWISATPDDIVFSLLLNNAGKDLFIGGQFDRLETFDTYGIGLVSALTSNVISWGNTFPNQVYTLALKDNRLFFGGDLPFLNTGNDMFAHFGHVTPPSLIVLPLQILRFNVQLSGNTIEAFWQVMNETKDINYTLQRSNDGRNFTNITRIKGNGRQHYQDEDNNMPASFKYYYRIMVQESTGKIMYSPVQVIFRDNQQKPVVYPTRVQHNRFYINISSEEQAFILVAGTGNVVHEQRLQSGTNEVRPTHILAKGFYSYAIRNQKTGVILQTGKIMIE
jgi:hypothetical protein